jgi:Intracellular proteinase inhibitor
MHPWHWLLLLVFISTVLVGVLRPALFGYEPSFASVTLRLEIPSEVRAGEPLPLKMAYKNLSYRPVQLTLGGRPAHDFIVTTPEDKEVWRWTHGAKILQILEVKLLRPKGQLQFTAEWNLVDNSGVVIAPGIYLVRGILRLEPPQQIETEPTRLVISP